MNPATNQTLLTACLSERQPLRYTPAGLPALDLVLEHTSEQGEAGGQRQVRLVMRSVAIGTVAERLEQQALGSVWRFSGFLASPRQGQRVVFHIQDFQQA
ncbi:MAG: primosomal replication protein [Pseudomonadota bacterium]